MGKIVRQGVEYGGSSNSADCIKYNDTKSVKEAIDEIKASSSSNPTASSVTFNNTDTGLAATNVQDAITEVNGKLMRMSHLAFTTDNMGEYIIGQKIIPIFMTTNNSEYYPKFEFYNYNNDINELKLL